MKPITFSDFDFSEFKLTKKDLDNGAYMLTVSARFTHANLCFNNRDELHSETSPAVSSCYYYLKIDKNYKPTFVYHTGITSFDLWFKDGFRHRTDGPAFILRDANAPRYNTMKYYLHGKLIPKYEYFKMLQPDKWAESFNRTVSFQGKKYKFFTYGPDGKLILEKI